jgi:two-component sensor histidine kinase
MAELRATQERAQVEMAELRKLVDSNAKAIQALGDQTAADRELARESREDIRDLAVLVRDLYQTSQNQEREIRMQAGEIQNLADSIQNLYSRQPPSDNQ